MHSNVNRPIKKEHIDRQIIIRHLFDNFSVRLIQMAHPKHLLNLLGNRRRERIEYKEQTISMTMKKKDMGAAAIGLM